MRINPSNYSFCIAFLSFLKAKYISKIINKNIFYGNPTTDILFYRILYKKQSGNKDIEKT